MPRKEDIPTDISDENLEYMYEELNWPFTQILRHVDENDRKIVKQKLESLGYEPNEKPLTPNNGLASALWDAEIDDNGNIVDLDTTKGQIENPNLHWGRMDDIHNIPDSFDEVYAVITKSEDQEVFHIYEDCSDLAKSKLYKTFRDEEHAVIRDRRLCKRCQWRMQQNEDNE